tara:strand:- start:247 stop:639 length:393 start_codon:yes stop_codon:yes gene_type:complete
MNKKKSEISKDYKVSKVINIEKYFFNSTKKGYLYTVYREIDEKIIIGFSENYSISKIYNNPNGYKILAQKPGTFNDLKKLKQVLFELGFTANISNEMFKYSLNLIKLLDLLGWPTNSKATMRNKVYKNLC